MAFFGFACLNWKKNCRRLHKVKLLFSFIVESGCQGRRSKGWLFIFFGYQHVFANSSSRLSALNSIIWNFKKTYSLQHSTTSTLYPYVGKREQRGYLHTRNHVEIGAWVAKPDSVAQAAKAAPILPVFRSPRKIFVRKKICLICFKTVAFLVGGWVDGWVDGWLVGFLVE